MPSGMGLTCCMARKHKKEAKVGHFLREWREKRDYSLDQVVEMLQTLASDRPLAERKGSGTPRLGITKGNLSRIERGHVPYNQFLLELLAEIYQTSPASLIMRDPSNPAAIWDLWDSVLPSQRPQALRVLEAFTKKTGTSDR